MEQFVVLGGADWHSSCIRAIACWELSQTAKQPVTLALTAWVSPSREKPELLFRVCFEFP